MQSISTYPVEVGAKYTHLYSGHITTPRIGSLVFLKTKHVGKHFTFTVKRVKDGRGFSSANVGYDLLANQ